MSDLFINVRAVLSFFDEDVAVSRHSNAIKTMAGEEFMFALLIEYLSRSGYKSELLDKTCTTGHQRGHRLDGWLVVRKENSEEAPFYYQVEVKSWSAHGVGSGARFVNRMATADALAAYRQEMWSKYWTNGRFVEDGLNKVLTPMKCPNAWAEVKPLACLWSPIHPSGDAIPFFSVKVAPSQHFDEVFVFSASSFLRNIEAKEPTLKLQLPQLAKRMEWINALFMSHA